MTQVTLMMVEKNNKKGWQNALFFIVVGIIIGVLAFNYLTKEDLLSKFQIKKKEKAEEEIQKKKRGELELAQPLPPQQRQQIVGDEAIPNAIQLAKPSVVNINTITLEEHPLSRFFDFDDDPFFRRFFDRDFFRFEYEPIPREGLGSGFIIDGKNGYVLTNEHVIRGAEKITVTLPGVGSFKGEVIGKDEVLDIAVIKIRPKKRLPAAVLGDSSKVRLGEWVIAIGNPFGVGQTATIGIISATNRTIANPDKPGRYLRNLLQTDAAINRGNSGGPLINLRGEVIGINLAIMVPGQAAAGNVGIGFAIPINSVKKVLKELIEKGRVDRPPVAFLGVTVANIEGEYVDVANKLGYTSDKGALIIQVEAGSAADKAGLQPGDIILQINTKKIRTSEDVVKEIRRHKPGDIIKILIFREGRKEFKLVKLGARESFE